MAYGHAERNLAAIRQLEAETEQLILSLEHLVPEQSAWPEKWPEDRAADHAGDFR